MSLPPEVAAQLEAHKNADDVTGYYDLMRVNGHDYGSLAYEAVTDTGRWGQ